MTKSETTPLVSIGMPVYNGEKYIRQALDSILAQDYENFELIISDNASTDSTEMICNEYAAKDSRVKYVRQPENIGSGKNFSFVAKHSHGKYFSWLAHDDLLNKDFIGTCSEFLDMNPNCVLVSGDFLVIDENSKPLETQTLQEIRVEIPWEKKIFEFYRYPSISYPMPNAFLCIYGLMRRNVLIDVLVNLRCGPLLQASELPLLSRLAAVGEISSLPMILRKYRCHKNSVSHVEREKLLENPIKAILLYDYNTWWHILDQILVLCYSKYHLILKLKIIRKIILLYFLYFPTFVKKRLYAIKRRYIKLRKSL